MAGNYTRVRPVTYLSGAIIFAANHNNNEDTIYDGHNDAFHETTGHEHTGATGDAPKLGPASLNLGANYTWTGTHIFNGATTLTAPTIADFTNANHNHENAAGGGQLNLLNVHTGGTTGTGNLVFATSPTLTTPVLTTPTIADFTNANHTHASAAQGGKFDVSLAHTTGGTGTGAVVLELNPVIQTPTIANFTNSNHNHLNAAGGGTLDAAAIATGTFANARISSGNVTQHETVINHNNLANLTTGDPHTQYPLITGTETISGAWDHTGELTVRSNDPPSGDDEVTREGICKAWGIIDGDATTPAILDSYNISGISRSSIGIYVVSWDRDFSSADYCVVATICDSGATDKGIVVTNRAVGSCTVRIFDTSSEALEDRDFSIAAFGVLS